MTILPVLAAALLQSAAPVPSPAASPRAPLRIEAAAELVSVTAVVRDKSGFVKGLGPKDVEVLEDGVPQKLAYFREATEGGERIPLSMVLVLDASGSMSKTMPFLHEAANTLVHKMEEGDRALVVDFNEGVRSSAEFSSDQTRLEEFIEAVEPWGGTSLNDAIQYGLSRVKDEPGRKTVVVFTDGADTTSQMKEGEVIDYARSIEATVYCIGFRGQTGMLQRSPRGFLRKISEETGGQFFFPDKVGDLIRIFADIANELQHHYVLAYEPQHPSDGTWHTLAVRVKRPDVDVRVRKGYFAVKRRPRQR